MQIFMTIYTSQNFLEITWPSSGKTVLSLLWTCVQFLVMEVRSYKMWSMAKIKKKKTNTKKIPQTNKQTKASFHQWHNKWVEEWRNFQNFQSLEGCGIRGNHFNLLFSFRQWKNTWTSLPFNHTSTWKLQVLRVMNL